MLRILLENELIPDEIMVLRRASHNISRYTGHEMKILQSVEPGGKIYAESECQENLDILVEALKECNTKKVKA
jgi:hypothetical protein